ncbi:MAG: hypothetical protein NWF12_01435 [Candidatus Bathyarchaeota archaeon]|nr:hypothetical protein [Candidatus Bathyarchaeota archaeon]
MIRKTGRTLRDLWIYFKAGHGGYLVYSLSLLNFVVLQHRLLISYIPFLSRYMGRLSTFIVVFAVIYFPVAVIIGYLEYRKGEITRRPMLNPYTQDSLEASMKMRSGLLSFINGDLEGARTQLEESLAISQRWKRVA